MTDSSTPASVDHLLEHASWLRALARSLVRDPNAADDLAQSTWLAALQHAPSADRPVRQWLATVTRNFARQEKRGSGRRSVREEQAARMEALASAGELVERAELHRELVGAVLALDEPYRTVILLRFFDERTPREIARQLGVPIDTVRTRLARGLERLRVRLDTRHGGDRSAWLALFVPLAERPLTATSSALGALVMNAKWKAVLAGMSVVCAVAVWIAVREEPAASATIAAAPHVAPLSDVAPELAPLEIARGVTAERTGIAAPSEIASVASTAPSAAPAASMLRGKVLDANGQPAVGVSIVFASDSDAADAAHRTTSGTGGVFEMADPKASGRLVADDPKLTTVLAGMFGKGVGTIEPIVVVAPRIPLAGRVVDEQGLSLEGVRIALEIGEGFRTRFGAVLDRSVAEDWHVKSDASGAFVLENAPFVAQARLRASSSGFDAFEMEIPPHGDGALTIQLVRPRVTDGWVRGRVVGRGGEPIDEAYVSFGIDSMQTDDDGAFAFQLDDERSLNRRMNISPEALTAVKRGFQAVRMDAPRKDGKPDWPATVTLRLEHPPLEITGRVLSGDGEPVEDARVWIADATMFGAIGDGPAHVESMLAGAESEFWHFVETDSDGRFRLEGLLDREYCLRAMDRATLLREQVCEVRAGSQNVEIRFAKGALHERVAGRVVSNRGEPLPRVRIFPMCDAFQARFEGQVIGTSHDGLDGVVTDDAGRFEIPNVPKSLVYLRVEGESVIPLEFGRVTEGDPKDPQRERSALPFDAIDDLTIVVDQRCHVQVELADPTAADEVAVLDRETQPLILNIFVGNGRQERPRTPLVDGRSAAFGVADRGRTIVLYRGGVEVLRTPIELKPGPLQTVRL